MARNIPGGYPQIPYRAVKDGRLKATDIRVLCVIINHCYEGGVKARVSYRKLKDECHARLETIQSSIERLKETGWISLTSGGQFGGDNVANLYTVHFDNGYEDIEEDTPSERQDTTCPDRQKTHKTLKPSKKSSDTSHKGGYSDQRKNYYKTLKTYAESLDIVDAWRCEILEWVNRVLDKEPDVMNTTTPKQLFTLGTRKFKDSDLRYGGAEV